MLRLATGQKILAAETPCFITPFLRDPISFNLFIFLAPNLPKKPLILQRPLLSLHSSLDFSLVPLGRLDGIKRPISFDSL